MVIKGLTQVMTNLNMQLEGIKVRSLKGLVESALLVRRETETWNPVTPVDLGNLRSSYFIAVATGAKPISDTGNFKNRRGKAKKGLAAKLKTEHAAVIAKSVAEASAAMKKKKAMVIFGYSANYAAIVHEAMFGSSSPKLDANYSRPGSGPKWFEAAIKRNKKQIIELVKKNAKLK